VKYFGAAAPYHVGMSMNRRRLRRLERQLEDLLSDYDDPLERNVVVAMFLGDLLSQGLVEEAEALKRPWEQLH